MCPRDVSRVDLIGGDILPLPEFLSTLCSSLLKVSLLLLQLTAPSCSAAQASSGMQHQPKYAPAYSCSSKFLFRQVIEHEIFIGSVKSKSHIPTAGA